MITIKIPTAVDLWKALAQFAYRRYMRQSKAIGKKPVGIPGNRDPDNPCPAFDPRRGSGLNGDCDGDGHYLCRECIRHKPDELAERAQGVGNE